MNNLNEWLHNIELLTGESWFVISFERNHRQNQVWVDLIRVQVVYTRIIWLVFIVVCQKLLNHVKDFEEAAGGI